MLTVVLLGILLGCKAQAVYNPSTGRWLSRDPIGEPGGKSLYAFAENNPITRVDQLGQRFTWTAPWIYTLSQPIGDIYGATKWWLFRPSVPFSKVGCPLGQYKLIIYGSAQVVSCSVVGDVDTRAHEDRHLHSHFEPAPDAFAETAESRAGICMCPAKARCVQSAILGPMVTAYRLQALAVAKRSDCEEYGHDPSNGGVTCAEAGSLEREYVAALEALTKALNACD